MNLIDAIKSGRDFKFHNLDDSCWMYVDPVGLDGEPCVRYRSDGDRLYVTQHVLEADYVIKEPKVTLTRSQFLQAYGLTMTMPPWNTKVMDSSFALALAYNLGLKESP